MLSNNDLNTHLDTCLTAQPQSQSYGSAQFTITAEGLYRTLLTELVPYAHIVDPALTEKFSPIDVNKEVAEQGVCNVLKTIAGYQQAGKSFQGMVNLSALDKPLFIPIKIPAAILATQPDSNNNNTTQTQAWVTFVVLPKNYQPPFSQPLNNTTEQIFYFGSQHIDNKKKQRLAGFCTRLIYQKPHGFTVHTDTGREEITIAPLFPNTNIDNSNSIKLAPQLHLPENSLLDIVSAIKLMLTGDLVFSQTLQNFKETIPLSIYQTIYTEFPKLNHEFYYRNEFRKLLSAVNSVFLQLQPQEMEQVLAITKVEDEFNDGRSIKIMKINHQGMELELRVGSSEDDNMVRIQHFHTRVAYLCKAATRLLAIESSKIKSLNNLIPVQAKEAEQDTALKLELITIYETAANKQIQQLWQLTPGSFKQANTLSFNPSSQSVETFNICLKAINKLQQNFVKQLAALTKGDCSAEKTAEQLYLQENQLTAEEGRPTAAANIPIPNTDTVAFYDSQVPNSRLTPEQMVWKAIFEAGYDAVLLNSDNIKTSLATALDQLPQQASQQLQQALAPESEDLTALEQIWQQINSIITDQIYSHLKHHPKHLQQQGMPINLSDPRYIHSSTIRHTEGVANAVTETLTAQCDTSTETIIELHRSSSKPPIKVEQEDRNSLKRLIMTWRAVRQSIADFATEMINKPGFDVTYGLTSDQPLKLDITSISLLSPNIKEKWQYYVLNKQGKEPCENELRMTREDFIAKRMCHNKVFQITVYSHNQPQQIWVKPNFTSFNQTLNTPGRGPLDPLHSFINAEGYYHFSQQMDDYIARQFNLAESLPLNIDLKPLIQVFDAINNDHSLAEQRKAIQTTQATLAQKYTLLNCILMHYQMCLLRIGTTTSMQTQLEQQAKQVQEEIKKLQTKISKACKQYLLERHKIINDKNIDLVKEEEQLNQQLQVLQQKIAQQDISLLHNLIDTLYLLNNSLGVYMVQQTAWTEFNLSFLGKQNISGYKAVKKFKQGKQLIDLNYRQVACIVLASQKLLHKIVEYYCKSGEDRTGKLTIDILARGIFRHTFSYYPNVRNAHAKTEDIKDAQQQQAYNEIYDAVHEFGLPRWLTERCQRGAVGLQAKMNGGIDKSVAKTAKGAYKIAKEAASKNNESLSPILLNKTLGSALAEQNIILNIYQVNALNETFKTKPQLTLAEITRLLTIYNTNATNLGAVNNIQPQILASINQDQSYLWFIHNYINTAMELKQNKIPWLSLSTTVEKFIQDISANDNSNAHTLNTYAKNKLTFLLNECTDKIAILAIFFEITTYLLDSTKSITTIDSNLINHFLSSPQSTYEVFEYGKTAVQQTQNLSSLMSMEDYKQKHIYKLNSGNISSSSNKSLFEFTVNQKDIQSGFDSISSLFSQPLDQKLLQDLRQLAQGALNTYQQYHDGLSAIARNHTKPLTRELAFTKPRSNSAAIILRVSSPILLPQDVQLNDDGCILFYIPKTEPDKMYKYICLAIDDALMLGGIHEVIYVAPGYENYIQKADTYYKQLYYGALKPDLEISNKNKTTAPQPQERLTKPQTHHSTHSQVAQQLQQPPSTIKPSQYPGKPLLNTPTAPQQQPSSESRLKIPVPAQKQSHPPDAYSPMPAKKWFKSAPKKAPPSKVSPTPTKQSSVPPATKIATPVKYSPIPAKESLKSVPKKASPGKYVSFPAKTPFKLAPKKAPPIPKKTTAGYGGSAYAPLPALKQTSQQQPPTTSNPTEQNNTNVNSQSPSNHQP